MVRLLRRPMLGLVPRRQPTVVVRGVAWGVGWAELSRSPTGRRPLTGNGSTSAQANVWPRASAPTYGRSAGVVWSVGWAELSRSPTGRLPLTGNGSISAQANVGPRSSAPTYGRGTGAVWSVGWAELREAQQAGQRPAGWFDFCGGTCWALFFGANLRQPAFRSGLV
jgi:hypothetical protein